MHREYIPHYGTNLRMKFISALAIGANKGYIKEAISKLLKIVKAPSLRSDKGSVFPPSHKATAGQAAVTLQVASANYPLQLFANGIFAIF